MNTGVYLLVRARSTLAALLVIGACLGIALAARAEEAKTESSPAKEAKQSQPARTDAAAKRAQPPARKLSGAELYSMHCNRCHPERYPTERTAAQWKTILLHMRVRANLPAEQSRTILKYLQDNSGR